MPLSFTEERVEESVPINDDDLVRWWTAFKDPFLNQLLEETLNANFDYRIALQRVYQARAQYWIQFTQILPEVDFDAQGTRFRASQSFTNSTSASTTTSANTNPVAASTSITPVSPIQNFFQLGFDAIWEIDLFGRLRRAADAAYDTWEATNEDARGVKILVLSETANTYVSICALQKKNAIASEVVTIDEELLELSFYRFDAGLTNEQEVELAKATLEGDKAALKALQIALKQTIYSLAVLLGKMPELVITDFQIEHPIPQAEGMAPYTLPSDLLRRRPDISSAERQLAAATEEIGVAVAELFPQVSLVGSSSSFAANPLQGANIGYSSPSLSKLFSGSSRIWGIGGILTLPMIDFGKRLSAVDVQVFLRNQAFLNYQKTVISALQESEQALTAYFNEEERMNDFYRQVQANRRNFDLIADEFQAGLVDYSQVLEAKETWLSSVSNLAGSQQALASDLIAIYLAIGGDW